MQAQSHLRTVLLVSLAALTAVLTPSIAHAQSSFLTPVDSGALRLSNEQARYLAAAEQSIGYLNHRFVVLDAEALRAGRVTLDIPGASRAEFETVRYETHQDGATWSGTGADALTWSLIVVREGMATGSIFVGDRAFALRPVTGGLHMLVEFDPLASARLTHDDAVRSEAVLPQSETVLSDSEPLRSPAAQVDAVAAATAVDILVVFTPQALASYPDPVALSQFLVAQTNQYYANSGIPTVLRLAGVHRTPTASTGSADELQALIQPNDGRFDDVHAARDQVGADVVAMIIAPAPFCGVANLNSTEATAFSLTSSACTLEVRTFAHEVGHNFGADHDPPNGQAGGFSYGHGKVNLNTANPAQSWLTIMAYAPPACSSPGYTCRQIPYFSTPDPVFEGQPTGDATTYDNARVHRERAATVAAFRSELLPATAAVSPGAFSAGIETNRTATETLTITNSPGRRPLAWSVTLADRTECVGGQRLNQDTGDQNTVTSAGGRELGQSLTVPCRGTLTSISVAVDGRINGATWSGSGTLRVYRGAGAGGTEIASAPFSITTNGPGYHDIALPTPVAVVKGEVLTWFLDLTTGSLPVFVNVSNPYSEGMLYQTVNGLPGSATPVAGQDVRFIAAFGSPTPWVSLSQTGGSVASGTSSSVSVLFSAVGLSEGTYTATLRLSTTAPDNPTFDIPVTLTVSGSSTVAGAAGWRLLAPAASGMTIADLAAMNLVQGVPGYYPASGANLLTEYNGTTFSAGGSAALSPGRGFFWYFYNRDITPGGPSNSRALPMTLATTRPAVTADVPAALSAAGSRFNMLGNPFGVSLNVSGVASWPGASNLASTVVQMWNGTSGTYETSATRPTIASWQGFFVEAATAGMLTIPASARATGGTLVRPAAPEALVAFELATADGARLDRAAVLTLGEGRLEGQDTGDAAKLTPVDAEHVLLAFATGESGALRAVESRPLAAATLPLAVASSGTDGRLVLTWPQVEGLPAGWVLVLRDLENGQSVDLSVAERYTFTVLPTAARAADAVPALQAASLPARFELTVGPRGVVASEDGTVGTLALAAPRPNPAHGIVTVAYETPTADAVRLSVVDLLGREVAVVVEGDASPGRHMATLDTARLAPGVYVMRLASREAVLTRRLVVVR